MNQHVDAFQHQTISGVSNPQRGIKYIAIADFLRVASISLIAWYHFWQQSWLDPSFYFGGVYINLQKLVSAGYMMVDSLLVLSGFLLTIPYAQAMVERKQIPAAKNFYFKRLWRIVPSYFFALTTVFLLYAIPGKMYPSAGNAVLDLVAHLTFTHNLSSFTYFMTPFPSVLWTLAVEVQFYLLFPPLMKWFTKQPISACLVLVLCSFCARQWVYLGTDNTTYFVNQLPCMLDLYACGMAAALWYVRLSEKVKKLPCGLMPLGTLLCFLIVLQIVYIQPYGDYEAIRHAQLLWRFPMGVISACMLLLGGLSPRGTQKLIGNIVTRFLSGISYNFYIWHQFLALRLKDWHIPAYTSEYPQQTGEVPWQFQYMFLCFVVGILAAGVVTYIVEKPLSKYGRKRCLNETNCLTYSNP